MPVQKFSTDATLHRRMVSAMKIDRIVARLSLSTGLPQIFVGAQKRLVSSRFFAIAHGRCALRAQRARCRRHRRAQAHDMCTSMRGRCVAYTLP
jgi:hypothetical protein